MVRTYHSTIGCLAAALAISACTGAPTCDETRSCAGGEPSDGAAGAGDGDVSAVGDGGVDGDAASMSDDTEDVSMGAESSTGSGEDGFGDSEAGEPSRDYDAGPPADGPDEDRDDRTDDGGGSSGSTAGGSTDGGANDADAGTGDGGDGGPDDGDVTDGGQPGLGVRLNGTGPGWFVIGMADDGSWVAAAASTPGAYNVKVWPTAAPSDQATDLGSDIAGWDIGGNVLILAHANAPSVDTNFRGKLSYWKSGMSSPVDFATKVFMLNLTSSDQPPVYSISAAVSPDGASIVYVDNYSDIAGATHTGDIRLFQISNGESVNLYSGAYATGISNVDPQVAFTGDGAYVAIGYFSNSTSAQMTVEARATGAPEANVLPSTTQGIGFLPASEGLPIALVHCQAVISGGCHATISSIAYGVPGLYSSCSSHCDARLDVVIPGQSPAIRTIAGNVDADESAFPIALTPKGDFISYVVPSSIDAGQFASGTYYTASTAGSAPPVSIGSGVGYPPLGLLDMQFSPSGDRLIYESNYDPGELAGDLALGATSMSNSGRTDVLRGTTLDLRAFSDNSDLVVYYTDPLGSTAVLHVMRTDGTDTEVTSIPGAFAHAFQAGSRLVYSSPVGRDANGNQLLMDIHVRVLPNADTVVARGALRRTDYDTGFYVGEHDPRAGIAYTIASGQEGGVYLYEP